MSTERFTSFKKFKMQAMTLIIITMLVVAALQVTPAHAAAIASTQAGGNWNAGSTWVGGVVPAPGDTVTIVNGATVTVTADASVGAITFAALTDTSSTVSINPGVTLTVSGAVTIRRGVTAAVNTLAVGAGNLNAGGVAFTAVSGTTGGQMLTISTGTVVVAGNIVGTSGNNSPTVSFSDAGLLKIGGAIFPPSNGTLTTFAGSTVEFNGSGTQTVQSFPYSNLTLSGSGTKTLNSQAGISGNLTLAGTAVSTTSYSRTIGGNLVIGAGAEFDTASSNTATLTVAGNTTVGGTLTLYSTATKTFSGDVTVNNGGVWNEAGAAVIAYGGSLQNDGSYTASTGLHAFNGSAKTIGGAHAVVIPNLRIAGTVTNNGVLTVSTSLVGSGALANGATGVLNFAGGSIVPALDASTAGNTVNYNGAAQAVSPSTYDSLILQGSGVKTIGGGAVVSGNLSIAPTGSASVSIGATQIIAVGTLTLGGADQPYGTWGGTGSGASHINTTYFAATTGQLNVGKANLTITANNRNKTYGTALSFVGTEFTTSGLASGDSVTSVTLNSTGAASAATVAGSPYPIVPSAAVGTGLDHYNIQYVNGSLAVNPAPLTVSGITADNKNYDGTTSATIHTGSAALGGVLGGDTVTLNSGAATGHFASANAGTNLDVQVSGLTISGAQSANYALVQPVIHNVTISPVQLTVQAPSKTILDTFIGEPTYTPLVTGFVGGDTLAVVSGLGCNDYIDAAGLTQVPDPVNPTDPYPGGAGDFFIICRGASAANYTFSYQTGNLHVDAANAPQLVLPPVVNFGSQQMGTGSLVRTITLSNTGSGALHLYGISTSNPQYHLLSAGSSCYSGGWPSVASPLIVAATSGSCTIRVQFVPVIAGPVNGNVNIVSDNGTSPNSVPLAGSGYAGVQIMNNRSFEADANNDKVPDGWQKTGIWTAADGRDCTVHFSTVGSCSLRFVANGQLNVAQQVLLQSGNAGNGFRFSLFSRAANVPLSANYMARVMLYNGTTLVAVKPVSFVKGSHAWQVASANFTAPAAFNKVVIQVLFKASAGTVWFDLGSLTR